MRNIKEYYVYILASKKNGTLYAGMTGNLGKRTVRHKAKNANQFAAKYDVDKLVYYEKYKNLEDAVKREKQVKKWRREWKLKLIEKQNPEWEDLFIKLIKIKNSGPLLHNQRSNFPRAGGGIRIMCYVFGVKNIDAYIIDGYTFSYNCR